MALRPRQESQVGGWLDCEECPVMHVMCQWVSVCSVLTLDPIDGRLGDHILDLRYAKLYSDALPRNSYSPLCRLCGDERHKF
jgi:hypothetical protein